MFRKAIISFMILGFGLSFFLISCSSESDSLISEDNYSEKLEGLDTTGKCYKPVFPITFSFPDGSTEVVDSARQMHELFHKWRQNHKPDSTNRPSIVFPITLENNSGEQIVVNSEEEIKSANAECKHDKPMQHHGDRPGKPGKPGHGNHPPLDSLHKPCFTIVFPISMNFGTETKTFNSKEEQHDAIKAFIDAAIKNHTKPERPEFVFPLTIAFEDGTTKVIADKKEFENAHKSCNN